jgi:DNA repair exonuclease SbcCD nuclease subunit
MAMLIATVADIHLDERHGDSGEGLDEQVERLLWIGENAREAGAETMLVAGDTFHNSKSSAAERNAAVRVYQAWADLYPVICVKGNNSHDGPGEIAFLSALKADHAIYVFERPGEYVSESRGDIIACLPFPEKSWLVSKLDPNQDINQIATQTMRDILLGWKERFKKYRGARLLLGHLELGTAMSDSGQPMTGKCFIEMSESDLLVAEADVFLLGHIHKFQTIQDRIVYAGSVRQTTHGEDNIKGYILINVERGKPPIIEHRQAPGRELITVEATWQDTTLETEAGSLDNLKAVPEGTIVRLKYHVPDGDRGQAAEQAERAKKRWIEAGAYSVKLDPRVKATYRVRSETIREAKTNEDRLVAWWESRGQRPDREKQIKEKLSELEAEAT